MATKVTLIFRGEEYTVEPPYVQVKDSSSNLANLCVRILEDDQVPEPIKEKPAGVAAEGEVVVSSGRAVQSGEVVGTLPNGFHINCQ